MYAQTGPQGQQDAGAGFTGGSQSGPQDTGSDSGTDNIQDADFEEVK
jgi:hypothetical protein